MGRENEEWLRSLSDRALREEIKYGKLLAEGSDHARFRERELTEAKRELARRSR